MPIRTFRAPDGRVWEAWEIVGAEPGPGSKQPRLGERRGQDLLLYKGPERRRGERRGNAPGLSLLPSEYSHGWLAFQSATEKRRLAPPPPGWAELAEDELVRLWQRARPAAPPRR